MLVSPHQYLIGGFIGHHRCAIFRVTRRVPVQRAALSGMKYPTRESPARDAASPISTTNLVAITVAPSTGHNERKFWDLFEQRWPIATTVAPSTACNIIIGFFLSRMNIVH